MGKYINSKWNKLGIMKKDRNKIYSRLRLRAKLILKQRHIKEYKQILRKLYDDEYNILKINKRLMGVKLWKGKKQ